MALSWIFIDIGGPILDDGPLFDHLAEELRGILIAQDYPATEERFQEAMRLGWCEGAPSTLDYIIRHFASTGDDYKRAKEAYWQVFRGLSDEEYRRLQILRPGVVQALEVLSSRYKLATLSNNIIRVKSLLEAYGIAGFFSASGISEEVGYSKPDPRIYQHVLREAGCGPEEAMMVGDRLDNDILPARKLGMMTAHIKLKHNFGAANPSFDQIDPDFQANSLRELAQILVSRDSSTIREEISKENVGPAREGGAR
jgi:HAD superfamily hydrolase (TIGR01549 family)